MNKKATVEVEMTTKGFEDAAEDIEMIADAMDAFPSTINAKARDCEINIHNTNWIEQKQPEMEYAKGGIVKEDKGPEVILMNDSFSSMLKDKIVPLEEMKEKIWRLVLKSINEMCTGRPNCAGCIFNERRPDSAYVCMLRDLPKDWKI